jgi:hypothetical protein
MHPISKPSGHPLVNHEINCKSGQSNLYTLFRNSKRSTFKLNKTFKLNIKDLKYLLNKHFGEEWRVEED